MTKRPADCIEEPRHKAQRTAHSEISLWLLDYAEFHGLTDADMCLILTDATRMFLRHIARDDEERRTGFRHRLAGE